MLRTFKKYMQIYFVENITILKKLNISFFFFLDGCFGQIGVNQQKLKGLEWMELIAVPLFQKIFAGLMA